MPPDAQADDILKELLANVSRKELGSLFVKALRRWRAENPNHSHLQPHGSLGLYAVPLLAERKAKAGLDARALSNRFLYAQGEPWMADVVDFLWWLVRTGLATPLFLHVEGHPTEFRLTGSGERLLASDGDHPLLPDFAERAARRCPGLPEPVLVHLADAQACIDHGLLRPATALLGVAYETAIESVIEKLVSDGKLTGNPLKGGAEQRIKAVKTALDAIFVGRKRECAAAYAAYDFADALRQRRNDASHTKPTFEFDDRPEIESLLFMAGHHLAALWSPAIA